MQVGLRHECMPHGCPPWPSEVGPSDNTHLAGVVPGHSEGQCPSLEILQQQAVMVQAFLEELKAGQVQDHSVLERWLEALEEEMLQMKQWWLEW